MGPILMYEVVNFFNQFSGDGVTPTHPRGGIIYTTQGNNCDGLHCLATANPTNISPQRVIPGSTQWRFEPSP